MLHKLIQCCFVVTLLGRPTFGGDPLWLREAASASIPSYGKDVPAVVLLDESQTTIREDGRVATTRKYAVRILSREGRGAAVAREVYLTGAGKIREMNAWLLRPVGGVKRYEASQVLDAALVNNDVYNEVRVKLIDASDDAEVGSTFGYEVTSEDRSIFTQFEWQFQSHLPTLVSRASYMLPKGWNAKGVIFNHPNLEPVVSGSIYTWELRSLPFIQKEPASPVLTSLAPRLAVSLIPPSDLKPDTKGEMFKTFDSWASVSRWVSELSDPRAIPNEAIIAKARELTANAKTEYARIRAIALHVQSVNYISIQTGLGRGGGYRPHSAAEVFAKSYGDCKDKANLMRAMLKAIDITAYPVAIYAGDRTYVREQWPSPQQFNHCIIAVKVSNELQAPTVIEHSALGRLLIFDPTAEDTSLGDLPGDEQGSLALVVAGEDGALARMPVISPEVGRLERQTEARLASDGSLMVSVRERAVGQAAAAARGEFRRLTPSEYRALIERWVAQGAPGAHVSQVEPLDHSAEGCFELKVSFAAAHYAQPLEQNRLLLFKPTIVARRESLLLIESSRKHPVALEPLAYTETVRVKLPVDFKTDELPEPAKIETSFGAYATTYEVKDDQLLFTRSLVVRAATIPVEQYESVRSFFARIRAAEQSAVVLQRK
jgi:hypothetical protein